MNERDENDTARASTNQFFAPLCATASVPTHYIIKHINATSLHLNPGVGVEGAMILAATPLR